MQVGISGSDDQRPPETKPGTQRRVCHQNQSSVCDIRVRAQSVTAVRVKSVTRVRLQRVTSIEIQLWAQGWELSL